MSLHTVRNCLTTMECSGFVCEGDLSSLAAIGAGRFSRDAAAELCGADRRAVFRHSVGP